MSSRILPAELWLEILSYLDYKSLMNCNLVDKYLKDLSNHDFLWKRLCKKYWLVDRWTASFAYLGCRSSSGVDASWKEYFACWYADMGRYIEHYAEIKGAWNQISNFLKENCPEIHASINPGVTEAQLDDIECKFGYNLPLDLRCSYRIHNGQKLIYKGLFGSVCVDEYQRSDILLDIYTASEGPKNKYGVYGALSLTHCLYTGNDQLIALSETGGQILNQVFAFDVQRALPFSEKRIFILSKNFSSWLTDYATSLVQSRFTLLNGEIFKLYREPECIARTQSICVTAATCFLPEKSLAGEANVYTYQITMKMDEDADESESCQLETRHWMVSDIDGYNNRIDGAGVVGEFPIMRPGVTFSWSSKDLFNTTHGSRRGHFTMRYLKTGKHFDLECPVFHMKSPPYMTIISGPN